MDVLNLDGCLIFGWTSQVFWTRDTKKQDIHPGYPARIDFKGLSVLAVNNFLPSCNKVICRLKIRHIVHMKGDLRLKKGLRCILNIRRLRPSQNLWRTGQIQDLLPATTANQPLSSWHWYWPSCSACSPHCMHGQCDPCSIVTCAL